MDFRISHKNFSFANSIAGSTPGSYEEHLQGLTIGINCSDVVMGPFIFQSIWKAVNLLRMGLEVETAQSENVSRV